MEGCDISARRGRDQIPEGSTEQPQHMGPLNLRSIGEEIQVDLVNFQSWREVPFARRQQR